MPRLQAVFYRAPGGSEPVEDFIESMGDPAKQAAIDNQVDRLNLLTPSNPHLPFPHSSEVRCDSGNSAATTARSSTASSTGARELDRPAAYVPQGHRQDPGADIRIADERWEDFKSRMDAESAGLRALPAATRRDRAYRTW